MGSVRPNTRPVPRPERVRRPDAHHWHHRTKTVHSTHKEERAAVIIGEQQVGRIQQRRHMELKYLAVVHLGYRHGVAAVEVPDES